MTYPVRLVFILAFTTTLISCGGEKRRPVYYGESTLDTTLLSEEYDVDTATLEDEKYSPQYALNDNEIAVPFRNENGVKYVQVKVNGVSFEMIFDTGCSGALISVAEANYLYNKGRLTEDDIVGTSKSQIADGSVVENMVVNLREVVINDQIVCPNVLATVSSNVNAPLLLGNEILDRTATIKIDNENQALIFKLK